MDLRLRPATVVAGLLGCVAPAVRSQDAIPSLVRVPEFSQQELAVRATRTRAALERVDAAVVHVSVQVGGRFSLQRSSSGVVVSPDGLVLTDLHLVQEARTQPDNVVIVRMAAGREYPASVVAADADHDLAVVSMTLGEGEHVPFVRLRDSRTIQPGETMLVSARAQDTLHSVFIGSASNAQRGLLLGDKEIAAGELLLSDVNLRTQTDGAPVFDLHGRLCGIVNSSKVLQPVGKDATEEQKAAFEASFGFAVRSHVAAALFPDVIGKLGFATETEAEKAERLAGIPSAVAAARGAIVSVRRASLKEMPAPDPLDPYGKFPRDDLGSGVIVHPRGLVLTNASIVGSEDVIVALPSGQSYPGKTIARKPEKNIALVLLELPEDVELPFLELADSSAALLGERVVVLGNRYGRTLSVKVGSLSSHERSQDVGGQHLRSQGHVQTDANISALNTGGALIDITGRLLGIADNLAVADNPDRVEVIEAESLVKNTTLGFAVPVNWIRQALRAELESRAGKTTPTLLAAPTEHREAERENAVTRVVTAHADSFLNVFVKKERPQNEAKGLMADLFPEAPDPSTMQLLGQGSGVIIDPSGLALTNWHVVDAATYRDGSARRDHKVFVSLANGEQFEAEVLSTSRIDDLALLQLKIPSDRRMQAVRLGDSDTLAIGETAVAIGNPHGFANSVTVGLVSAKSRDILIQGRARKFRGMLQTDAAINAGNSGGALIDLNGYLVGINSAGNSRETKEGYAIPVNYVRDHFHSTLLSSEKLRSVFLGLETRNHGEKGLVVESVDKVGPAADAGVEVGDRILTAQGRPVASQVDFVRVIRTATPFQPFGIEIERGGERKALQLVPASDAAWAVFRRARFAVRQVAHADDPALLDAANEAAYREYTGDPNGEPATVMQSGLVVSHVDPDAVAAGLDMKRGDVVVGVLVTVRDIHLGDRQVLERIETVRSLRDYIRGLATSEGASFELWTVRDGTVIRARGTAKKPKVGG